MVEQEILDDMEIARQVLMKSDTSILVIRDKKIISRVQGLGIRPIMETIEKLGDEMEGTVVGDRILGKASALLCKYSKVKGVYSLQATKTAIAILIMSGIPGQTEELVPFIKNKDGNDICPFEKLLKDTNNAEEAYKILKNKLDKK